MGRRGSYIAASIMREYRQKQAYERLKRANCIEKDCNECEYTRICSEKNEGKDE